MNEYLLTPNLSGALVFLGWRKVLSELSHQPRSDSMNGDARHSKGEMKSGAINLNHIASPHTARRLDGVTFDLHIALRAGLRGKRACFKDSHMVQKLVGSQCFDWLAHLTETRRINERDL